MVGHFFVTFIFVMAFLAVASVFLWQYIAKLHSRFSASIIAIILTGAALAALVLYGADFRGLVDSPFFTPAFYGSMAGLSWLFMFLLAFPILVPLAICVFLGRHLRPVDKKKTATQHHLADTQITRRTFLKGLAAAIPMLALGTSTYGIVNGERDLSVTYHRLAFNNLPDYLDGYRIVQLSDTHMGLFFSPERLKEALLAAIQTKADRLVITGDLCDELSLLPKYEKLLNEAAPHFPDGIDFVYGNHEYYRGINDITAMLKRTPVRILRNSNYQAANGSRPFYIAGVDYAFAKDDTAFKEERKEYTEAAMNGIPENAFVLLLAHHSAFIDDAFEHGIDLTLAGHTHGGQFAPIGWLVQLIGFKYLRGLYSHGLSYGYVNRGTGHWLPLRVMCSREVSVFEMGKSGG